MRVLDPNTGVDVHLEWMENALHDWVQQPAIVKTALKSKRATAEGLAQMADAIRLSIRYGLGRHYPPEWWDAYTIRIHDALLGFLSDRNVRRKIAQHLVANRDFNPKEAMTSLQRMRLELEETVEADRPKASGLIIVP